MNRFHDEETKVVIREFQIDQARRARAQHPTGIEGKPLTMEKPMEDVNFDKPSHIVKRNDEKTCGSLEAVSDKERLRQIFTKILANTATGEEIEERNRLKEKMTAISEFAARAEDELVHARHCIALTNAKLQMQSTVNAANMGKLIKMVGGSRDLTQNEEDELEEIAATNRALMNTAEGELRDATFGGTLKNCEIRAPMLIDGTEIRTADADITTFDGQAVLQAFVSQWRQDKDHASINRLAWENRRANPANDSEMNEIENASIGNLDPLAFIQNTQEQDSMHGSDRSDVHTTISRLETHTTLSEEIPPPRPQAENSTLQMSNISHQFHFGDTMNSESTSLNAAINITNRVISKPEEREKYLPNTKIYSGVIEFIRENDLIIFPNVDTYNDIVRETENAKRTFYKSIPQIAKQFSYNKFSDTTWLTIFVLNFRKIENTISSLLTNNQVETNRRYNVVNGGNDPEWIKFHDDTVKFCEFMYNAKEIGEIALVHPQAIILYIPFPTKPEMFSLVKNCIGNNLGGAGYNYDSAAIARLLALEVVAVKRRTHVAIYEDEENSRGQNALASSAPPAGVIVKDSYKLDPITLSFVKVDIDIPHPVISNKLKAQMVKNTIKAYFIKNCAGEDTATINDILSHTVENVFFNEFLNEIYNKVIKNNYEGFDTWMRDMNYITTDNLRGLLQNHKEASEQEDQPPDPNQKTPNLSKNTTAINEDQISRNDTKSISDIIKGQIPPRSIDNSDAIPHPEKLLKGLGLEKVVNDNNLPKTKNKIPIKKDAFKEVTEHNSNIEDNSMKFKLISTNLGRINMGRIQQLVDTHPTSNAFLISEMFIKSDIISNRVTWPNGYQIVSSNPSPNGKQSFTAIILRNNLHVIRELEDLHANCASIVQVKNMEVVFASIYHFNPGKNNGYHIKFNGTAKLLLKDLRKIVEFAGSRMIVIAGDFNLEMLSARRGESKFIDQILEILKDFVIEVDFITHRRYRNGRQQSSRIDNVITRNIKICEIRSLNHTSTLMSDGHLGIMSILDLCPPDAMKRELWRTYNYVDDELIHKYSMEAALEEAKLELSNLSEDAKCKLREENLVQLRKKVKPMSERIIEINPDICPNSLRTKKYIKYAICLEEIIEDLEKDGVDNAWSRKIHKAWRFFRIMIWKLKAADARKHSMKVSSEKEIDQQASWRLFNKKVKNINVRSTQGEIEKIADDIGALQSNSKPPGFDEDTIRTPNFISRRLGRDLKEEEKLKLESFRVHPRENMPNFIDCYKKAKRHTVDLNGLCLDLAEKLCSCLVVAMVIKPVRLSITRDARGKPRILGSVTGFADDVLVTIAADSVADAIAAALYTSYDCLHAIRRIGIEAVSSKSELVIIGKGIKDEQYSITVEGNTIKSKNQIRYLGIRIGNEDGKLSFKPQETYLKARFRTIGECIRKISHLIPTRFLSKVVRGTMAGTFLHGQDFGPMYSTNTIKSLQKSYNTVAERKIPPPWYLRRKINKDKSNDSSKTVDSHSMNSTFNTKRQNNNKNYKPNQLSVENTYCVLDKIQDPTLFSMSLQQFTTALYKVFRFQEPASAANTLQNVLWICYHEEPIVQLPWVFKHEYLESEAKLASRFNPNRYPCMLNREEEYTIKETRRLCNQIRSIIKLPCINIMAIKPDKNPNSTDSIIDDKTWPFHKLKLFNKLNPNLRKTIVNFDFPKRMKEATNTRHRHPELDTDCCYCEPGRSNEIAALIPGGKEIDNYSKNELINSQNYRTAINRWDEIENDIKKHNNEIETSSIILAWWYHKPMNWPLIQHETGGKVILAKARQFSNYHPSEIIKMLIESKINIRQNKIGLMKNEYHPALAIKYAIVNCNTRRVTFITELLTYNKRFLDAINKEIRKNFLIPSGVSNGAGHSPNIRQELTKEELKLAVQYYNKYSTYFSSIKAVEDWICKPVSSNLTVNQLKVNAWTREVRLGARTWELTLTHLISWGTWTGNPENSIMPCVPSWDQSDFLSNQGQTANSEFLVRKCWQNNSDLFFECIRNTAFLTTNAIPCSNFTELFLTKATPTLKHQILCRLNGALKEQEELPTEIARKITKFLASTRQLSETGMLAQMDQYNQLARICPEYLGTHAAKLYDTTILCDVMKLICRQLPWGDAIKNLAREARTPITGAPIVHKINFAGNGQYEISLQMRGQLDLTPAGAERISTRLAKILGIPLHSFMNKAALHFYSGECSLCCHDPLQMERDRTITLKWGYERLIEMIKNICTKLAASDFPFVINGHFQSVDLRLLDLLCPRSQPEICLAQLTKILDSAQDSSDNNDETPDSPRLPPNDIAGPSTSGAGTRPLYPRHLRERRMNTANGSRSNQMAAGCHTPRNPVKYGSKFPTQPNEGSNNNRINSFGINVPPAIIRARKHPTVIPSCLRDPETPIAIDLDDTTSTSPSIIVADLSNESFAPSAANPAVIQKTPKRSAIIQNNEDAKKAKKSSESEAPEIERGIRRDPQATDGSTNVEILQQEDNGQLIIRILGQHVLSTSETGLERIRNLSENELFEIIYGDRNDDGVAVSTNALRPNEAVNSNETTMEEEPNEEPAMIVESDDESTF
ncbi:unnamed protein product [Oikopleura dioica]|uniref:Uncharacterized protein n=1 Tax=Oikopleura dioica TaxID=34765 RepID=E4WTD9_OIKDI|nr:unnamed protein product [Oikopleura dioica]